MSTTDPNYSVAHTAIFLAAITGLLANPNIAGTQLRVNGNSKDIRANIISQAMKIADDGATAL